MNYNGIYYQITITNGRIIVTSPIDNKWYLPYSKVGAIQRATPSQRDFIVDNYLTSIGLWINRS
jgi:hypothetical protein